MVDKRVKRPAMLCNVVDLSTAYVHTKMVLRIDNCGGSVNCRALLCGGNRLFSEELPHTCYCISSNSQLISQSTNMIHDEIDLGTAI